MEAKQEDSKKKASSIPVSLELYKALRERKKITGIPVTVQVRRAVITAYFEKGDL